MIIIRNKRAYFVLFPIALLFYFINFFDLNYSKVVNNPNKRLEHEVFLSDFKFLIVPKRFPCNKRPVALISVKSAMMEFQKRQIIRRTYAKTATDLNMVVLFFLGTDSEDSFYNSLIRTEADAYDDIVQADYSDTYWNVTMKSYSILLWQTSACPNAKYYFNTDSDVIVFPRHLLDFVNGMKTQENALLGWCNLRGSVVVRNKLSKWYVSPLVYPEKRYPPHCLGFGYLMTGDVPGKLLTVLQTGINSWRRWKDFPIDDVLFTGILVKETNVTLHRNKLVSWFGNKFDLCNETQRVVSAHRYFSQEISPSKYPFYMELLQRCNSTTTISND